MQKLFDILTGSTKAKVLLNEPLSRHTTFKIGGPADILVIPSSQDDLINAVKIIRGERVPLFLMGNGSNLLVSDDGVRGAVIQIAGGMNNITFDKETVKAEAGTYMNKLIIACAEQGLSGLELFIGIPAAVGGAVAMNMGSWGGNISRFIDNITVLTPDGKKKKVAKFDCGFDYRGSRIAKEGNIILEAELKLSKEDPLKIKARQDQVLSMKALGQPIGSPSAGCVFKNPYPEVAGKLVDDAGLKGEKAGGAQISEVHGNYIINTGGATASDVISLISRIKGIVREKSGIELETEIKMVGFGQGS